MRLVTVLLVLILAGCVSPQQQAAERQAANDRYWASLNSRCSQMGYTGDQHRGCMMQLHQIEEQRRMAIGAALIGSGAFNQRPIQPLPMPQQQPQPLNTNCYWIGNQLNCTTR